MNKVDRPNQRSGLEGENLGGGWCRGQGRPGMEKGGSGDAPRLGVCYMVPFKTRKRKAIAMAAPSASSHRGSCSLP